MPNQELEIDPNKNQDAQLYETCTLSLQLVVDLFVKFYDTVSPLLKKVLMLLISFIMRPHQILAGIGITALVRLMSHAGGLFSEDRWLVVVCSLKEASKDTLPDFSPIINEFDSSSISRSYGHSSTKPGVTVSSTAVVVDENVESLRARNLHLAINNTKCCASAQLLLIQVWSSLFLISVKYAILHLFFHLQPTMRSKIPLSLDIAG